MNETVEVNLKRTMIRKHLDDRDLDVHLSMGFIVHGRAGSLIALRAELRRLFQDKLIYPTLSSTPLFTVHWNDLNSEFQQRFEAKRNEHPRKR